MLVVEGETQKDFVVGNMPVEMAGYLLAVSGKLTGNAPINLQKGDRLQVIFREYGAGQGFEVESILNLDIVNEVIQFEPSKELVPV